MLYYFTDEQSQAAGPVEEAALYDAFHRGELNVRTQLAAEGSSEWLPLADVLQYYFTLGDEARGPMPLSKISQLAALQEESLLVMEPGGSEWKPVSSLLKEPALPSAPPASPQGDDFNVYAPPGTLSLAEVQQNSPPLFPGGVRAAGIIWLVYGALRLVLLAVVLAHLATLPAGSVSLMLIAPALVIPLVIGLTFISIGRHTCRGAVSDVLGNGVGSIGIAIVLSCMSYFLVSRQEFLIDVFFNSLLVIAGILALSHRKPFLAWKRRAAPARAVRMVRR